MPRVLFLVLNPSLYPSNFTAKMHVNLLSVLYSGSHLFYCLEKDHMKKLQGKYLFHRSLTVSDC